MVEMRGGGSNLDDRDEAVQWRPQITKPGCKMPIAASPHVGFNSRYGTATVPFVVSVATNLAFSIFWQPLLTNSEEFIRISDLYSTIPYFGDKGLTRLGDCNVSQHT